jgi:orotate phosphoribosyltransferase
MKAILTATRKTPNAKVFIPLTSVMFFTTSGQGSEVYLNCGRTLVVEESPEKLMAQLHEKDVDVVEPTS